MVTNLIQIYETDLYDVDKARDLLAQITQQHQYEFKHIDDLVECYAAWVELELREEQWDDASEIVGFISVKGLCKSSRLWICCWTWNKNQ